MAGPADFKYDVAFSLRGEDEALAARLESRVRDRARTFLFTERQKEIAGTDGEETFRNVFERDTRTVVVLLRSGWGETPWTRVEAEAIRNRGRNDGFEFVTFVRVGKDAALPRWYPQSSLWGDLERLGEDGAAAVIEERIRTAGGAIREETAAELAARLARDTAAGKERSEFLRSPAGLAAAIEELDKVGAQLSVLTDAVAAASGEHYAFWRRQDISGRPVFIVGSPVRRMSVEHVSRVAGPLSGSGLKITVWREHDRFMDEGRIWPAEALTSESVAFDLAIDGERGWRELASEGRFFTNHKLADRALKLLLKSQQSKPE